MTTRVLIADDHAFVSAGLARSIGGMEGFEVIACVENGVEAVSAIRTMSPDCAILDFDMPGANGLSVVLEAQRWAPGTRLILLTGMTNPGTLKQCVDAALPGILSKDMDEAAILLAVRCVCAGERVISPTIERIVARSGDLVTLSAREMEVLQMIARGKTNADAATVLGLSPKTVETHRMTLMKKMKTHSVTSLILKAVRDGLVDPHGIR